LVLANLITVWVGILVAIVLKKCTARPSRRFLNSKIKTPPQVWICQALSLPAPFPIRIPLGFLVRGICGNILNHTSRLVISGFLIAFLRKTLSLKIWREDILKGCRVNKPQSPYVKVLKVHFLTVRFFCFVLYLNFRGCKSKDTQEL